MDGEKDLQEDRAVAWLEPGSVAPRDEAASQRESQGGAGQRGWFQQWLLGRLGWRLVGKERGCSWSDSWENFPRAITRGVGNRDGKGSSRAGLGWGSAWRHGIHSCCTYSNFQPECPSLPCLPLGGHGLRAKRDPTHPPGAGLSLFVDEPLSWLADSSKEASPGCSWKGGWCGNPEEPVPQT